MTRASGLNDTLVDAVPVAKLREAVTAGDARRRKSSHGVFCILLLLLTIGALGHVAIHIRRVETALALGQARREQSDLRKRKRDLELEIGVLKDPERVMAIARDKLGLSQPAVTDIVPLSILHERVTQMLSGQPASPSGNTGRAATRTRPASTPDMEGG